MEADFEAWCNRLLDVKIEVFLLMMNAPSCDLEHMLMWNILIGPYDSEAYPPTPCGLFYDCP